MSRSSCTTYGRTLKMCHVVNNLIQNHDCRIGFKRRLAVELKITSFAMHTMPNTQWQLFGECVQCHNVGERDMNHFTLQSHWWPNLRVADLVSNTCLAGGLVSVQTRPHSITQPLSMGWCGLEAGPIHTHPPSVTTRTKWPSTGSQKSGAMALHT